MSIEVMHFIKVRANLEPAFREQLMRSPLKCLQEYDLTEDEKRQIVLPNFDWLLENKLAAMAYPESEDAFTLLYRIGIRAVLNLAEAPYPYEVPDTIGMLTRHIPVVDFTAPTLQQVKQALAMISSCLDRNMPVVVHCRAGLGRNTSHLRPKRRTTRQESSKSGILPESKTRRSFRCTDYARWMSMTRYVNKSV